MEKSPQRYFPTLLIFIILLHTTRCDIQTGSIDFNRQMGNLESINDITNILCYTHIFVRPFKSQPQIATSLTQFATDSEKGFHLEVRVRKSQLTQTQAKVMVYGRKQISVWSKIVVNFIAADRSDFAADLITLKTQDLSGCGIIKQRTFDIKLPIKFKKPYISAFINGFDIQSKLSPTSSLAYFQLSIEITTKQQQSFTIKISRSASTQIYSVLVSYVAIQAIINQNGYTLEVLSKSQIIQNPPVDSPFIFTARHDANLLHAKYIYGIEKFKFKTQAVKPVDKSKTNSDNYKLTKSIAILIDQTDVSIGSFDSYYLQAIQYSNFVIRQTMTCDINQIIVRDPVSRRLSCQNCSLQNNKIPNKQKDECICKQKHYKIRQKCYKLPQQSKYLQKQQTFICSDSFTMQYIPKSDTYTCVKTPLHKMLDSTTNQWGCIDNYVQISNQCIKIPTNGYVDQLTKEIKCKKQYQMVQNQCVKAGDNQYYDGKLRKFVCVDGMYRVQGLCSKPFVNSYYKEQLNKFVCNQKYYPKQPGQCQKIPQLMIYDQSIKKLICQSNYYDIKDIGCKKLPQTMIYNSEIKQFECPPGLHVSKSLCKKPMQNQQWSEQLKQFVCVSGSYKIRESCLKPKPNYRFSKLAQNFVCMQNFYEIGEECLPLPKNMKYEPKSKSFICDNSYQQVMQQNGKGIQCLQIPQNKQWSYNNNKFICKKDLYELKDSSCAQLKQYQKYNAQTLSFQCIQNHIRTNNNICRPLPLNSILSSYNTFVCLEGFYKKDQLSCEQCHHTCLSCEDGTGCKTCKKGYQIDNTNTAVQNNSDKRSGNSCKEICGDGIRYDQQCDDGNQYSGDGCSEQCKKQPNWICKGGSPFTKDKCQKLKISTPIPSSAYSPSTLTPASISSTSSIISSATTLSPSSQSSSISSQSSSADTPLNININPNINTNPQIKMLGMSHMYGKVILNIKLTYIPQQLLSTRYSQLSKMFRILTNSKLPLKTTVTYMDYSDNTFVVVYDFNKIQPIPQFITRVQIAPEIKVKYYTGLDTKSLFIKVNPMYMAQRDSKDAL